MSERMSAGRSRRRVGGQRGDRVAARGLTCSVFAFFLAIVFFLEAALAVLNLGVLSKWGFRTVCDDEFYGYLTNYVNEQARYYTLPTGIDPEVLEDVFVKDNIQSSFESNLSSLLDGASNTLNVTKPATTLREHTIAFLEANKSGLSEDVDTIADAYVEQIMEVYRTSARIPGLQTLAGYRAKAMRISLVAALVLAVCACVLIASIMGLHHFPHRALRHVAHALGGAALMCMVAPGAVLAWKPYRGLAVAPQFFYHFCMRIIERGLVGMICAGLVLVLATVALVVIIANMRAHAKISHVHASRSSVWYGLS